MTMAIARRVGRRERSRTRGPRAMRSHRGGVSVGIPTTEDRSFENDDEFGFGSRGGRRREVARPRARVGTVERARGGGGGSRVVRIARARVVV